MALRSIRHCLPSPRRPVPVRVPKAMYTALRTEPTQANGACDRSDMAACPHRRTRPVRTPRRPERTKATRPPACRAGTNAPPRSNPTTSGTAMWYCASRCGLDAVPAKCQYLRFAGIPSTGATGLEPATSGVTGRRSNQLSYAPARSRDGHRRRSASLPLELAAASRASLQYAKDQPPTPSAAGCAPSQRPSGRSASLATRPPPPPPAPRATLRCLQHPPAPRLTPSAPTSRLALELASQPKSSSFS